LSAAGSISPTANYTSQVVATGSFREPGIHWNSIRLSLPAPGCMVNFGSKPLLLIVPIPRIAPGRTVWRLPRSSVVGRHAGTVHVSDHELARQPVPSRQ